ncbi:MAG: flagellar assembly protein A, partial [Gemmatimonadota bacterium]|nr:flagellar assembly protein A [Gemmatimonadota bacterium]
MSESWELITVSLSKDELKATINVPFMTDDGPLENPLLLDHARMALRRSGVIKGIKEDLLKSIFEDALFDKEILIAEGTAPQHGENARLEFFFETKREFEPPEDEDGRIDYKDVSLLNNVNKTDRLCRLHPPTAGKPGLTVT